MHPATAVVADIVAAITPLDTLEQEHIRETLSWLAATDDIFRREPPATPPQHLVSYVVVVDPDVRTVLLGAHRKSGLHLPMGGHVDPGEDPLHTARREAAEELGTSADFTVVGESPLFLTVTRTVGPHSHRDVSLWYVIRGHRNHPFTLDPREFAGGGWWEIDRDTLPESDPHMSRFLTKLRTSLSP
jgi:8-oxo-dGTP pyrophosphatase MutT (NUDIX family)